MVKWSDTWYEKGDQNAIKFGKCVEKKSSTHAFCRLCNHELEFDPAKYTTLQSIQTLKRHSEKSKLAFSNTYRYFETSAWFSSTTLSSQEKVFIIPFFAGKKVSWRGNVAIQNSRRGYVFMKLWQCPFSISVYIFRQWNCKNIHHGKSKASYLFQDGLGSLQAKWSCQSAFNSEWWNNNQSATENGSPSSFFGWKY